MLIDHTKFGDYFSDINWVIFILLGTFQNNLQMIFLSCASEIFVESIGIEVFTVYLLHIFISHISC